MSDLVIPMFAISLASLGWLFNFAKDIPAKMSKLKSSSRLPRDIRRELNFAVWALICSIAIIATSGVSYLDLDVWDDRIAYQVIVGLYALCMTAFLICALRLFNKMLNRF